jgi:hypothetical protein
MQGYVRAADRRAAERALEASRNKKATHEEADYWAHGNAEKHCAKCLMFEGVNKCSAVEAPISPQAVCKYFMRKESLLTRRLRKGVD